MIKNILSLQNILAITFLILAFIIVSAVTHATVHLDLLDLGFWLLHSKYYTLIIASVFFLLASLFSFFYKKSFILFGNIALTIMLAITLNKIIAVGIFQFENEHNPIGYIIVFIIYLIILLLLNSNKNISKFNIKRINIVFSVLIGIIIVIPMTLNFWAFFNLLNK